MLEIKLKHHWVIQSLTEKHPLTGKPLYFSSGDGWVDIEFADIYSPYAYKKATLPLDSKWVRV